MVGAQIRAQGEELMEGNQPKNEISYHGWEAWKILESKGRHEVREGAVGKETQRLPGIRDGTGTWMSVWSYSLALYLLWVL